MQGVCQLEFFLENGGTEISLPKCFTVQNGSSTLMCQCWDNRLILTEQYTDYFTDMSH